MASEVGNYVWRIWTKMILRNDKGKLPAKTKIISTIVALSFCVAASSIFKYENSEFCINIPQ
jgi:hypothetical protein